MQGKMTGNGRPGGHPTSARNALIPLGQGVHSAPRHGSSGINRLRGDCPTPAARPTTPGTGEGE